MKIPYMVCGPGEVRNDEQNMKKEICSLQSVARTGNVKRNVSNTKDSLSKGVGLTEQKGK